MEPIILIGPIGAGKTTVGNLLAEKLSLPFYSLDEEDREYITQVGFDAKLHEAIKEKNFKDAYGYIRGFFDEATVRFLDAHDHGILDFGGGHVVVPDPAKQKRINDALRPYANVFFLMPSEDLTLSKEILYKRNDIEDDTYDLNPLYFEGRTFWDLAKHIVYTDGKTPEQTCDEILSLVR